MKTQLEMQAELEKIRQMLDTLTVEELQQLEQEIVAEAEATDKEVAATTFEMPAENYDVAAEAIRFFLNKRTVQWQYTLGMVGMYDFWGEVPAENIPYPQLDSILRVLGEMQFTGYEEWVRIVMLNKFFEPLREQYVNVTQKVYDVATKHNMIMEKLDLNTPVQG